MAEPRDLKAGDVVRVIGGPFVGDTGPVHSVDQERGRACVLVPIFGDTTTVELPLSDVERVG
ncbi:KOW motif-containing protein [Streptacidiphilus jiangxiensis]|uniref:Transcriptional antiterminator NusG n=1 Tax=Streptacidiphilus jiangxiensis TaxID=235985 RepID=A0A1H7YKZ1_STRJI|nr:KOW motif-containing protein [Streptacidiphilus jiangxiensis]SEM46601.1 transcriptional antiterminator NusG [Streptacidiphilus jiangxiensis]